MKTKNDYEKELKLAEKKVKKARQAKEAELDRIFKEKGTAKEWEAAQKTLELAEKAFEAENIRLLKEYKKVK